MSLDTIAFLGIHVCINNPCWQSSGIIIKLQILCSYLIYTDRLLDVFFLLLAVILLELHENPRRKDWVTEKKYTEEFVWRTSLFWLHTFLLMSFSVAFFIYSLPFVYSDFMQKKEFCSKKIMGGTWLAPPCSPNVYNPVLFSEKAAWCVL